MTTLAQYDLARRALAEATRALADERDDLADELDEAKTRELALTPVGTLKLKACADLV